MTSLFAETDAVTLYVPSSFFVKLTLTVAGLPLLSVAEIAASTAALNSSSVSNFVPFT